MNSDSHTKSTFWSFFIDHFRLTYIIVIAMVLFGVGATLTIPKESNPEVDIPIIVISTAVPGASALDVEELVTNEIESEIQNLEEVETYTSSSREGVSVITIEFDPNADSDQKIIEVRERVDRAEAELPSDASEPRVEQISFSNRPILTLALSGPFDITELKEFGEILKTDLESIQNVSNIEVIGAPEAYIEVVVRPEALAQQNVTTSQISQALQGANSDVPIGSIQASNSIYSVRLDSRLTSIEEVRNTVISATNGAAVLVRDVAQVQEKFTRLDSLSRLGTNNSIDTSVTLQVFKSSGEGDILQIANEVLATVTAAQESGLPDTLITEVVENDAELIREDLTNLLTSGAFTVLIVLGLLILFLGWREALLASAVIPLSMLTTLGLLAPLGYTINFITLFSLILALGILVDAAIVVTEGIFKNMERGKSPAEAALATVVEFQKPLIAGTLTTVFVFIPMLFMSGIIGQFIQSIPITVTIVLLAAIFISLGIITTLASQVLKGGQVLHAKKTRVSVFVQSLYERYHKSISGLLENRKHGRRFLIGITLLFFVSLSLPIVGVLQVNMFPSGPQDRIFIDVSNPIGTPLTTTNTHLAQIEERLLTDERIDSFLTTVGQASGVSDTGSTQNGPQVGSIVVNIENPDQTNSSDLIREYDLAFADVPAQEVRVAQLQGGPPSGSPIQIQLRAENLDELENAARVIAESLSTIKGTRDVDDGIAENAGEIFIDIDRAQAQGFGVTPSQVAATVRTAVTGTEATTIKTDGEDFEVLVRSEAGADIPDVGTIPTIDVSALGSIQIGTPQGSIPLSTFADISLVNSRAAIAHDEGDRVVTVTAQITEGTTANAILQEFRSNFDTTSIPNTVNISYAGEAEDIAESFASLGRAMLVGMFMIFGLLVWQFRSYRQPLFVLATIPLALIGVLPGLALVNQPFSFPGFIGVVALAGIVVNNAIILIDAINTRRSGFATIKEAVLEGVRLRFRPIILTTITTVTGMVPLALSNPTWAPVAFSIIFGLLFSTVLTLFVIPLLYNFFGEKKGKRV